MTDSPFATTLLAGKRVVITGGGTGLGRGVARYFAQHGAQVHLWGRRQAFLDEAVAEVSEGLAGTAHAHVVDVRNYDLVDTAMAGIWAEHGPVTSVVNNAAANFIAPTASLSARAYDAVSSTVMDGSFNTTHSAGKRWIAEGISGAVISTLTTWVWSGSAFVVPSAMGKAAVHAMTMWLPVESARHNIRLNALAPGPIPTDNAWEMLNPTDNSSIGATQPDTIPA